MKIKRSELIQLANKYIGNDSLEAQNQIMLKIAVARAARISYTTLGDNPKIDYEADIKLHDRLLKSKHLSCFEHCARAMSEEEYESFYKGEEANKEHVGLDENKGWCNNYRGFIQYRYLAENQYANTSKFNM
ncbi:MAG TPA: FAD-dependent thymidylate synthase [Gallicola sp.]|nr:FAD-dependent thymidylate synthase [Gallicola sp.]